MSNVMTLVAYLAVNPGQKDINVALLNALQHAIVMRHLSEEDQFEKRDTGAAWDVQQHMALERTA